jgi:hypothetical protein
MCVSPAECMVEDRGVDLPLTEFDPNPTALIAAVPPALDEPLPERVVMCFFPEVVSGLVVSMEGDVSVCSPGSWVATRSIW